MTEEGKRQMQGDGAAPFLVGRERTRLRQGPLQGRGDLGWRIERHEETEPFRHRRYFFFPLRAAVAAFATFAFRRATQPSLLSCGVRERARAPGGTSETTVVPAPTYAPSPTRTGATSCVSEPMKTSRPTSVRSLFTPSRSEERRVGQALRARCAQEHV